MSATTARPRLHHVNLKTNKLQELIDWYSTVLGMEVVHVFGGGAWLSNDDANHRIAILASPNVVDHIEGCLARRVAAHAVEQHGEEAVGEVVGVATRLQPRVRPVRGRERKERRGRLVEIGAQRAEVAALAEERAYALLVTPALA